MFSRRRERDLESYISLLRSEISDLRQALRDEREAFSNERKELLDRVLAATQPAAYRELHPRPKLEVEKSSKAVRTPFPGYVKSFRPPAPTSPLGPDFEAPLVTEEAPPDGDAVSG